MSGSLGNLRRVAHLVASGWGLKVAKARPLSGGLINRTWKVRTTDGGCWFLKEYAPSLADSAAFTLGVQEWARGRGLPIPAVRPTLEGLPVHRVDGGTAALSEFVEGEALQPHRLTPDYLAAAGDVLGRLLKALREHPASAGPARGMEGTTDLAAALDRVLALAEQRPFSPQVDALVRRCVATKRETLARWELGPSLYAGATWQLLHKDFRLENLLFDRAGGVSAVLDFDFAAGGYRAWEVMRASMTATWLHGEMDLKRADILLRACLRQVPMPAAEVRGLGRLWLDSLVRTFWPLAVPYESPADWHDGLMQILADRDAYTRWLSDHLPEVEGWLARLAAQQ